MDNEENQRQVSLVAHSPWKSRMRFPHFHRPGDAWKSGKPTAGFHFPTRCFSLSTPNQQRRPSGGFLSSPPSAPFFIRKKSSGKQFFKNPRSPPLPFREARAASLTALK